MTSSDFSMHTFHDLADKRPVTHIGVQFRNVRRGDEVEIAYIHMNGKVDLVLVKTRDKSDLIENIMGARETLKEYYLRSEISHLMLKKKLIQGQLVVVVDPENAEVERGLFNRLTNDGLYCLLYMVDTGKVVVVRKSKIYAPVQLAVDTPCMATFCFLENNENYDGTNEMLDFFDNMADMEGALNHLYVQNVCLLRCGVFRYPTPHVTLKVKGSKSTLNRSMQCHIDKVRSLTGSK